MGVKSAAKNHREGIIFASITAFIVGVVGIIDKVGTVSAHSPFVFSAQSVFWAFCFTLVCYLLFYKKEIKKDLSFLSGVSVIQLIIIGTFSSGLFILFRIVGLTESTGTFASLSQAVTTSLTVILAHFFLKERLSKTSWIMFIVIIIAIYFMSVGSLSFGVVKPGDRFILLGTLFLAVGNIISRLAVKKNNPFFVSMGRSLIGACFLFLITVLFFYNSSLLSFSFFSILSGLFWAANITFFSFALHRIGASLTTAIVMIGPVVTMILEVAFLSYHFSLTQFVSAFIVVICGVIIAAKR